jgi:hypothetical protein
VKGGEAVESVRNRQSQLLGVTPSKSQQKIIYKQLPTEVTKETTTKQI